MTAFTLQQLSDLNSAKYYLTKERFEYFFRVKHGYDKARLADIYKIWSNYPQDINKPYFISERTEEVLSMVLGLYELIKISFNVNLIWTAHNDANKEIVRVIYAEKGIIKDVSNIHHVQYVDVNYLDSADIIAYAELLKRQPEIYAVLPMLEEIQLPNTSVPQLPQGKYMSVFHEDMFYAEDPEYSSSKATIYIALKSNQDGKATFKRLLYTEGKGYMHKGEPNYDDEHTYNSYVVTSQKNWRKIGNLVTDSHLLKDVDIILKKVNDEKTTTLDGAAKGQV